MTELIASLPKLVAPLILALFSFITAYVWKFGIKNSGIHFDYILFAVYVVAALILGGAI